MNDLQKIRNEYTQKSLTKKDVSKDPINQFEKWFNEVVQSEIHEPTACVLSTSTRDGRPSGRVVLLKGYTSQGFVFFTNYNSRKGKELKENPYGALTFFWKELERQVRIEGRIEKVKAEESDNYFNSRPPGSKIGAWASPQSEVIPDRSFLEQLETQYASKFGDSIPRPDNWGGYNLAPEAIEFWQGRTSRLHDRILYRKEGTNWAIGRLAP